MKHMLARPERISQCLACGLGAATFLPIGVNYFLLLLMGLLGLNPAWRASRMAIPTHWRWLLWGLVVWPAFVVLVHGPDFEAIRRWSHAARVAGCLTLALTLTPQERLAWLRGFLVGGVWAVTVILTHELIVPLPDWDIWHALLSVRGNASSQKWIMLATGSGITLWLGWQGGRPIGQRALLLSCAVLWGGVVAFYSISRNAHVIVLLTPWLVLIYRYRYLRTGLLGAGAALLLGVVLWRWSPTLGARFNLMGNELYALFTEGNFNGSASVRAQMIWTAWKHMWLHPWLGTGLGSWNAIWAAASQQYPDMAGLNNPHNDYALWGMEAGVPGLVLVLAAFVMLGRSAWQNTGTVLAGAGWVATCALAVTAAANAPLRDAAMGLSLLMLAATLATWPSKTVQQRSGQPTRGLR